MLDLGWTELMVIGIVALIVVGPKDLPGMFRTVGNFMGKARRMAREFSKAMNDAADDAGVSDVKRTLDAASNPMKSAMDEVRKSTDSFTKATMDAGKPKGASARQTPVEKTSTTASGTGGERQGKQKAEAVAKKAATPQGEDDAPPTGKQADAAGRPAKGKAAEEPSAEVPATKAAEDKA